MYSCATDPNIASHADDTTPYSCATDIRGVALEVKASAMKLFCSFKNNHSKANPGKSHILVRTKFQVTSSHEKLLEVTINSELKFESHIKELWLSAVYQVPRH